MENYYKILGLKLGATLDEVEEKHSELLKEFDPEKQSDDDLKEFFKSEQDKVKEAFKNILKHLCIDNEMYTLRSVVGRAIAFLMMLIFLSFLVNA